MLQRNPLRQYLLATFVATIFSSPSVLPQSKPRGFYIETPFVHQADNYCGPAALSMVLRYWGRDANQYELAARYTPFPEKGLSGTELKETAAAYGFSVYSFSGEAEEIQRRLRNGQPVIVALHSSRVSRMNHFVVVVGWDSGSREWIVQDPAGKAYQRYTADDFAQRWAKVDNWSLLVLPASVR
jgi:ABC-type bacteriocin/lantibiotic exporter with double-glycine peptidase domain